MPAAGGDRAAYSVDGVAEAVEMDPEPVQLIEHLQKMARGVGDAIASPDQHHMGHGALLHQVIEAEVARLRTRGERVQSGVLHSDTRAAEFAARNGAKVPNFADRKPEDTRVASARPSSLFILPISSSSFGFTSEFPIWFLAGDTGGSSNSANSGSSNRPMGEIAEFCLCRLKAFSAGASVEL